MNKPWVQTIRRENGLVEHVCKHGCGHPAIGSVHFAESQGIKNMGIHGCDGCCQDNDWRLSDAIDGSRIANDLLAKAIKAKSELARKYLSLAKA